MVALALAGLGLLALVFGLASMATAENGRHWLAIALLSLHWACGVAIGWCAYRDVKPFPSVRPHMRSLVYCQDGWACILDNNTGEYEWLSTDEFKRRWTWPDGSNGWSHIGPPDPKGK